MGVDKVKRIFAQTSDYVASLIQAQEGVEYTTPSVDVDGLEYAGDEWDGSEAVASYPSAEDADLSPNFALVPRGDENRDAKSNYKLPFRNSHNGRANENAIVAAIAAINGARGGVEDVSDETLRDAYNFLVEMAVDAGIYEESEDAPEFSAQAQAQADASFSVDDVVAWEFADGEAVGRVDEVYTEAGTEITVDEDGNKSGSGAATRIVKEDNAGYHVQTYEGSEDGSPRFGSYAVKLESELTEGSLPEGVSMDSAEHGEDPEEDNEEDDGEQDGEMQISADLEAARISGVGSHDVLNAEDGGGLTGVVWAAGNWNAHINGEPTTIEVPEETIPETFQALQAAVENGNPPKIGLDHYDTFADLSVAEEIGFLDVAEATGFAMSEDETEIILTGSRFTSEDAREAYENGDFDGMGFSLHGGVEILDGEGDATTIKAGDAIERIDVVDEGAVSHAKVGNVPEGVAAVAAEVAAKGGMSDALDIVADAVDADGDNSGEITAESSPLAGALDAAVKQKATNEGRDYADVIDGLAKAADVSTATVYRTLSGVISCPEEQRLRAYANELGVSPDELKEAATVGASCEYADTTQAKRGKQNMEIEDFDNPEAALEAASGKLEEKNERIDELEASKSELEDKVESLQAAEEKAEAYEKIAAAQGMDEDADAQAVVDAFTEEIRQEIAELEASLPAEETEEGEVSERVEELAGKDPAELRAMRGDLSNKALKSREARESYDKAVAASEQTTAKDSDETEALVEAALPAKEMVKASESDKSFTEWVDAKHGIDASEYDDEVELRDDIIDATLTGAN
jgi:hypothetical protein